MIAQPWGGSASTEGVQVKNLLYHALRLAGVTLAPGRTPSPDQQSDALMAFNRMIGSWGAYRPNVWSVTRFTYPLTAGQPQYTIGPSSDFTAARPVKIERANIIDGTDHVAVRVVQSDEWADIRDPGTTGRPSKMWADMQAPVVYLNLWPVPDGAYSMELFTVQPLTAAASAEDYISYPEGYEQAIVTNLAVNLCQLWRNAVQDDLRLEARRSLEMVRRVNLPKLTMETDLPSLRGGAYDILTNRY